MTASIIVLIILILSAGLLLFVFRRKKKTSAAQISPSTEKNILLEEERVRAQELTMLRMRNAVLRQSEQPHVTEIRLARGLRFIELPDRALQQISDDFLSVFDHYLDSCWLTSDGALRTVFSGISTDTATTLGKMTAASRETAVEMDMLLKRWYAQVDEGFSTHKEGNE
ncbi:hypothetical protein [Alkalicoccus urumqiensis]|uniref:Uncharacterized protein n=1 Tax=Alkalicoccus urumqiensis TaxID=1548213 RepID=A0A2P6MKJ0_ALKUR|nr:hypothetical protein [Alkalicoccus urumqiensis]PRO66775.1 hypothetical protein C6I21_02285 [Alkalicoccus urumqiensis]